MAKREQKAEMFWEKYPERYTGEVNTEVHHKIAGMMQFYNKKFSELSISNVCNLAGVKNYQLLSVKGFSVRTDSFARAKCSNINSE